MKKNKVYKHKTNKFVIKAYLGLTGSGKTLSAVQNEVIPALEMGRDVWVNIWLNYKHPNLHYFEEWEDLHDVKNSLIFVDEVGDLLDPYNWADYSKLDKNVIRYHRKRFNDLIITSQDISQISKSIRIFIHIWVLCQNGSNFLTDFFYKLFFRSDVAVVKTLELGFSDLKVLALGLGSFDLNTKLNSIDEGEPDSFSEDNLLADVPSKKDVKLPKIKTYYYRNIHFMCPSLSSYRTNSYGAFCSLCGDFISLSDEQDLLKVDISNIVCPVHSQFPEFIEIKPVPFYSTTQEINLTPKEFVIKKFVKKTKVVLVQQN